MAVADCNALEVESYTFRPGFGVLSIVEEEEVWYYNNIKFDPEDEDTQSNNKI